MRRQLLIEIVSFAIFLSIYYDFFDGSQKPFWANVILVATILLVIGHNLIGYFLAKGGGFGAAPLNNPWKIAFIESKSLQSYPLQSVCSRQLVYASSFYQSLN